MEPGHEDREYWSTGASRAPAKRASMEPGHEDREYVGCPTAALHLESASMEPGHEDREYLGTAYFVSPDLTPQWSPVMKTGRVMQNCF